MQLRAPGMEAAQHAIQTCREVLNSSAVPAAQFPASLTVRDVVMRDWHLLPSDALASLREEMLQTAAPPLRPRVVRGTTQRAIEPTPSSPMHVLCPRFIRCTGRRMGRRMVRWEGVVG